MQTHGPKAATGMSPAFERKVRLSRASLLLERLWPRAWALIGLVAVFMLLALAGAWSGMPELLHKAVLAAFAVAALGIVVWIARTPTATRAEAIRRIERQSSVPHRPASSYEDRLTASADDPATGALWEAHKARLARQLARLEVVRPAARTDRFDPFAVRALALGAVAVALWLVGDSASDRLRAAFRLGPPEVSASARVDAWITPPPYTGEPPVILADGSRPAGEVGAAHPGEAGAIVVPERSQLVVRASGAGAAGFTLEITPDGKATERIEVKPKDPAQRGSDQGPNVAPALQSDVAEAKIELRQSSRIRVVGLALPPWQLRVVPDKAPTITLSREPQRLPRGSLKLTYKVEDDYGVVSAEGRITRVKPQPGDPATSWARPKANTGARPPLERPPLLTLRLPRANAKEGEAFSYHELTGHPWAGSRVRLVLSAKDHAGQSGKSEPHELILPQRRFENPIAKAVVEQRRLLVEDPRNRDRVARALDAIAIEPEGFIQDRRAYLGLRSAFWRLQRDKSRASTRSVVEQLWHVALRLEDGDLSEAERALREAQERLSKALQDGASDEEIQRLMNELRQALNDFMQQLQQQAEGRPMEFPRNLSPDQIIRQQDLERMMRDIENMARQGSRESAQQMLSQLRDMLEQLQSGRMAQGQGQQNQQMMQMMDQFGDIIGKQQQLLDDTFGEQQGRGQGEEDGQQGQGQQGQGQQGQGQQGQRQGRSGQGRQPGQQQGQGPGGREPGQGQGLGDRQGELRGRLGRLQGQMRQNGLQAPQQLDGAERAMEEAERALRRGDLDGATRAEQQALEQLRQGAQQMAEQMMRQLRQFGQGPGGDAPLDPLGRPQRTEGPDLGTSVKVPDEIDIQRAREILEELRRRLGEPSRPQIELDYIERLLRRF
ncbi:MAG: TIGR02302 family protein [Hyphomicrobiaceae bacterium]|nr:TIGR02302 family protein [Hyphomicrobiaceae bacterium]